MSNSDKKALIHELIKAGGVKSVQDIDSLVKDIYKETLEKMLEAELEEELGYGRYAPRPEATPNSRNGKRAKRVKTSHGEVELSVPRDRLGHFEPVVVPKGSRDVSSLEERVLALYGHGLTQRDIAEQLEGIYGVRLSPESISRITDKLLPEIESWQKRPLEPCYVLLWLDGLGLKIRLEGSVEQVCAHVVLGLTSEGRKDILGIWIGDTESAQFWLGVMTNLKNRGVKDILMATVDGLAGFESAIRAVYPATQVQRCIVHQVRYCSRFVPYKERKAICQAMKAIYTAPTEEAGLTALEAFATQWEAKYPYAVKSWYANWDALSRLYQYTPEIRRLMYTTNPIESLNRQFRKATKHRCQFPSVQAAMKVLYLTARKQGRKWSMRIPDWGLIVGQLSILFGERFTQYL